MTHDHTSDSSSEIELLIRHAGSRPVPGADRAARVRAAVEREWRAQARARRLKTMTRWMGAGVAFLAAAAAVFLVVRQHSTVVPAPMPAASAPIARVIAAHGVVTMDDARGRAAGAAVGQAVAAGSTIRTDGTSRATIALSPGTLIPGTLVAGGELRIDADTVAMLVDARTIELERGAIYLDSGTSTPGSFTVKTGVGTIRDIGTRFEVRAGLLRQGSGGQGDLGVPLSITVRDGAVQLERAGRIDRAPKGTELVARADGTVTTRSVDPFAADWAWTTDAAPPFIVENATLEAFLQWTAREGGWTIEWSEALRLSARTTILHGAIDGMTPAEALAAILPTCGLSPAFVNGRLHLRPMQVMR